MEKTYKFALEVILKLCEKESYGSKENIQLICETVLKESTVEGKNDVCTR